MCKVKLVLKQGDDELNKINEDAVNEIIGNAEVVMKDIKN
jgi:hypothetical protein